MVEGCDARQEVACNTRLAAVSAMTLAFGKVDKGAERHAHHFQIERIFTIEFQSTMLR